MDVVLFQDIEVDRCPQCQGIWCDKREQEMLKTIRGAEKIDTGSTPINGRMEAHILDCPRCHVRMIPFSLPEQPQLLLEKCQVCSGLFFDAGEFAEFKLAATEEKQPDEFL